MTTTAPAYFVAIGELIPCADAEIAEAVILQRVKAQGDAVRIHLFTGGEEVPFEPQLVPRVVIGAASVTPAPKPARKSKVIPPVSADDLETVRVAIAAAPAGLTRAKIREATDQATDTVENATLHLVDRKIATVKGKTYSIAALPEAGGPGLPKVAS